MNIQKELKDLELKINKQTLSLEEKQKTEKIFEKVFKQFAKNRIKFGTKTACKIFLKSIKLIRNYLNTNKKLLDKLYSNFISKEKLSKFLLEIYTAAQTTASLNSLSKNIGLDSNEILIDSKKSKLIEEFLVSSSLTSHPDQEYYNKVLNILQNENKITIFDIKEKASLALGSLVYLLKQNEANFTKLLLDRIKLCSNQECILNVVESFRNSKIPQSFEVLSNLENCKNFSLVCVHSLKALNTFEQVYFDLKLFEQLLQIFYNFEELYPSEVRVEALNLIFNKYFEDLIESPSILLNILFTLQNRIYKLKSNDEFVYYSQRLINQKMKNNLEFR